jgi:hypothetical protein
MPTPEGEMRPGELVKEIEEWAVSQGYTHEFTKARSEYGKMVVRDPDDGSTYTTIPNAHRGKKLRRDQVRYTVRGLNSNWRA